MAKKKVKKAKLSDNYKVTRKAITTPELCTSETEIARVDEQLVHIEKELNDLFKGLSLVNRRIDNIIVAIDKSKSVRNL